LVFSRAGRGEMALESVSLEKTLTQTLIDLEKSIEESKAVITHDPLPDVKADGSQMGHLFQNLVGNAVKFHGETPPQIHISARKKAAAWIFSVKDKGIGFDPK